MIFTSIEWKRSRNVASFPLTIECKRKGGKKKMDQTSKEPSKMKMAEESHLVWIQKRDSVTTYHFDSMAQLSALVFVSQSTSPDSLVRRSIFIVYRSPRNLFSLRNSPAGYSGRSLLHSSRVARMQFHVQLKPRASRNLGRRILCARMFTDTRSFSWFQRGREKKKEQSFWDSVTTLIQW